MRSLLYGMATKVTGLGLRLPHLLKTHVSKACLKLMCGAHGASFQRLVCQVHQVEPAIKDLPFHQLLRCEKLNHAHGGRPYGVCILQPARQQATGGKGSGPLINMMTSTCIVDITKGPKMWIAGNRLVCCISPQPFSLLLE